jgi:hypothetical protein
MVYVDAKDFIPHRLIKYFKHMILATNVYEEGNMENFIKQSRLNFFSLLELLKKTFLVQLIPLMRFLLRNLYSKSFMIIFHCHSTWKCVVCSPSIVEHHIDTSLDMPLVRKKQ